MLQNAIASDINANHPDYSEASKNREAEEADYSKQQQKTHKHTRRSVGLVLVVKIKPEGVKDFYNGAVNVRICCVQEKQI